MSRKNEIPDVSEFTAYDRYIVRNVIVYELSQWQPDMDNYIRCTLREIPVEGRLRNYKQVEWFFKCWIDLALRVTNIPNRSETSEHMIWDPEDKHEYEEALPEEEAEGAEGAEGAEDDDDNYEKDSSDEEDDEEGENQPRLDNNDKHLLPKGFKSKLVFRDKRFHRIWFHDKVGVNSHLPMIIPVSDTISFYLAFFILYLRDKNGIYLYNGDRPWKTVAADLKMFITEELKLGVIIHDNLIHNMRHMVADTIGIITNFNMSIMKDVSLVMRHTHQMQQKRYATGTKWGQVSSSLQDHQSYQRDHVNLLYPTNDDKLNTWKLMSRAIQTKKYIWGTTVITNLIPIALLGKCTIMNEFPLYKHFVELVKVPETTVQQSFEACFPNAKFQIRDAPVLKLVDWKKFHLKRDR